jgi:hypothetical protein
MFRTLSALLAAWVRSLRTIADLHPAVFSASDWSASQSPEGAQRRYSSADAPATRPETTYPSADMRPRPKGEQRSIERAASKLIVKRASSDS